MKYTYNIPRVPQVRVISHEKAHSNNLHRHFPCVDEQEDEINGFNVVRDSVHLLVQGKEETVDKNNKENKSIEHWVNSDDLDNFVSEGVGYRKAAK